MCFRCHSERSEESWEILRCTQDDVKTCAKSLGNFLIYLEI